jgi:hypothetical protein
MGSDSRTNNVLVEWYARRLDRVDEVYPYRVVSTTKLAGAAWDHNPHIVFGKTPRCIDDGIIQVDAAIKERKKPGWLAMTPST